MPYYKFKENDILVNRIKAYPKVEFFIYSGSIYYNNRTFETGSFENVVLHMTGGDIAYGHPGISLYELNVDRPEGSMIHSFLPKGGSRASFKTVTTGAFADTTQYVFGDVLNFPYPLSSSISRVLHPENSSVSSRKHIYALKNTLNYYKKNSTHYAFSSSDGHLHTRDLASASINMISVPSIFYGSSIKPGTVDLNFYITGTLVGKLQDESKNGELIQTLPTGSNGTGSVAGIILYKEGIILLTSSLSLDNNTSERYLPGQSATNPSWVYFAATGSKTQGAAAHTKLPSSSFGIKFSGSNTVTTMTAHAHAPRMHLNYTNNPTYIKYIHSSASAVSGRRFFRDPEVFVKNIVSGAYPDPSASFMKQTYISKIGIYDEQKNLIAIAKLANPIRKREIDDLTFKLKLDI